MAVTPLIPRSASEIGGYDAYSQVRNGDLWSATGYMYDVYVQVAAGVGGGGGRKVAMRTIVACSSLLRRGNGREKVLKTKFLGLMYKKY